MEELIIKTVSSERERTQSMLALEKKLSLVIEPRSWDTWRPEGMIWGLYMPGILEIIRTSKCKKTLQNLRLWTLVLKNSPQGG